MAVSRITIKNGAILSGVFMIPDDEFPFQCIYNTHRAPWTFSEGLGRIKQFIINRHENR
jgi:hypothetical protein